MHAARRKQLKDLYLLMKEEAEAEFEKYKHEPAFVAGLIAYAGEGDKLNERLARITNTDPRILLVFKRFISVYYPTYFNKMRVSVLLYPDIDSPTCLKWWSDSLGMSLDKFYKPVVIEGKHKTRRLQYGVSTLIIGSKSFKTKLLRLIDLVLET